MPDFVSYTPITRSTVQAPVYRGFTTSSPLDTYLQALTSSPQAVETSTETLTSASSGFKWNFGGHLELPYSTSNSPTLYYFLNTEINTGNTALNRALRQSADFAKNNAKSKSTHRCAHYVSNALEAAGIRGFDRKDGKDYDLVTTLLGMHDVTGETTFKKGDIAVTKTNDGTGHVAICNRDGAGINDKDAWTSDFNSRAHPYSESRISYAHVFRAKNGIKLIKKRMK